MYQGYQSASQKQQRDGKRKCPCCSERIAIRARRCDFCHSEIKKKEKDWKKIASSSSADGSYIKEKLFSRMDQLSTLPGWTGIVFLVHETEAKCRSKRVYAHSCSTRGAGSKILQAMGGKVLNSMKLFLSSCKQHGEEKGSCTDNGEVASAQANSLILAGETSGSTTITSSPMIPSSTVQSEVPSFHVSVTPSSSASTSLLPPDSCTTGNGNAQINPLPEHHTITQIITSSSSESILSDLHSSTHQLSSSDQCSTLVTSDIIIEKSERPKPSIIVPSSLTSQFVPTDDPSFPLVSSSSLHPQASSVLSQSHSSTSIASPFNSTCQIARPTRFQSIQIPVSQLRASQSLPKPPIPSKLIKLGEHKYILFKSNDSNENNDRNT